MLQCFQRDYWLFTYLPMEREAVSVRKKRKYYFSVTEEQIRQAALELERQENMDLEQEIAEANAWAEANHIVRRPFPEVPPPKRRPVRQILKPRRDSTVQIAKKSRFKPYIQLAAVFIIVILGGWYTQTDAVQGMRLDLVNLFTKMEIDRGILTLKDQSELSGYYEPMYIPTGLNLVNRDKSSKVYTQTYELGHNRLSIIQSTGYTSYIYNNGQVSDIMVQNKFKAHLFFQQDTWYITWYDDQNITVLVSGNIALEEGLAFINNLKWSQQ